MTLSEVLRKEEVLTQYRKFSRIAKPSRLFYVHPILQKIVNTEGYGFADFTIADYLADDYQLV